MKKKIWKISSFVGSSQGYKDATGTEAQFDRPYDVAVDSSSNVYVADSYNQRIRKITQAGVVSTIAGNGTRGYKEGIGIEARFHLPSGVAVDSSDNVYVGDMNNHRIRKITPEGEVSTLAGNGTPGYEEGIGEAVQFNYPSSVAVDSSDNVYVADSLNHRIRKITPKGEVSTFADGKTGLKNATGTEAQFELPAGVAVDSSDNVYVAEFFSHRIRKITSEGEVSTFAGSGTVGYKDATGTKAQFDHPTGVTVDLSDNIYVADTYNNRIRKITPEREVSTLIGSEARFNDPTGITVDASDNIYVADTYNQRIRKTEYK